MAKKTWNEVALNGAWTRKLQPGIPVLASEIIDEGIACIKAGAAIIRAKIVISQLRADCI